MELLRAVSVVSVPVIASGGAAHADHLAQALDAGMCSKANTHDLQSHCYVLIVMFMWLHCPVTGSLMFTCAGADAVLAASIFHYGEYTVGQIKSELISKSFPVRT